MDTLLGKPMTVDYAVTAPHVYNCLVLLVYHSWKSKNNGTSGKYVVFRVHCLLWLMENLEKNDRNNLNFQGTLEVRVEGNTNGLEQNAPDNNNTVRRHSSFACCQAVALFELTVITGHISKHRYERERYRWTSEQKLYKA